MNGVNDDGRRVCLITSENIQSRSFAQLIAAESGAECMVRTDFRKCVTSASMSSKQTLVMVDCLTVPLNTALNQIRHLPAPPGSHVHMALFNLSKDAPVDAEALALGIRGLFYLSADLTHLISGITAVFAGEVWIPRKLLVDAAFSNLRSGRSPKSISGQSLTTREREILALVATGATNDEIADKLFISSNTVRTHLYNLYKKLEVPNRMQAALWGATNL